MIGVVLWSDRQKNCAVIWCEDHRNLAFFFDAHASAGQDPLLGTGDLVEFDVEERDEVRFARDPCVVASRHYIGLPENLMKSQGELGKHGLSKASVAPFQDAKVLAFPETRVGRAVANDEATSADRRYGSY